MLFAVWTHSCLRVHEEMLKEYVMSGDMAEAIRVK